jgi:hypothetical protein
MKERSRGKAAPVARVARRVVAFALCLLIPVTHAATGTTAQEAQDAADWRALQAELARHIQVRGDARQQLVAAMLLAWPVANDAPAAHKAAAAARLPEAEAIFARVRASTDDPWVLWIGATDCRFGAALCDRDGAIDDLQRIEPDNAAVWLLALDRAHRRDDKDAQLAALEGMAASTRYDQYYIIAMRAWTEANAALPELPGFNRLVARTMTEDPAAALDDESLRALTGLYGVGAAMALGFPPFAPFTNACIPEEIAGNAWREACRGAAQVLVASDTVVSLGIGLSVAYRFAADDTERSALSQRRLEMDWLMDSVGELGFDGFDAEGALDIDEANAVVRRWREATSELGLFQALMREQGIPLAPPPGYHARGMTLAEREADRQARLAAPAGRAQ